MDGLADVQVEDVPVLEPNAKTGFVNAATVHSISKSVDAMAQFSKIQDRQPGERVEQC